MGWPSVDTELALEEIEKHNLPRMRKKQRIYFSHRIILAAFVICKALNTKLGFTSRYLLSSESSQDERLKILI